jgi:hypothetical protein
VDVDVEIDAATAGILADVAGLVGLVDGAHKSQTLIHILAPVQRGKDARRSAMQLESDFATLSSSFEA